jgi:hypothetical protein
MTGKTAISQSFDSHRNSYFSTDTKIGFDGLTIKIQKKIPTDSEVQISIRNRYLSQIRTSEGTRPQCSQFGWNAN